MNPFSASDAVTDALGRTEQAYSGYKKALDIHPDNAEYWYACGDALYNLGRIDECIECYRKVITLDPKDSEIWFDLGDTLGEKGILSRGIIISSRMHET